MPRTERERLIRKCEQIAGNLEWAISHCKDIYDSFEQAEKEFPGKSYEEFKEPILAISGSLVQLQKLITAYQLEL